MSGKIGILDPEGKYKNPLTGKKYSNLYREDSKIWSDYPVYKERLELIKLIKENQVLILESGTGSGKTVLLPKYALHVLNYKGKVVVTNPKQITTASNARFNAKLLDVKIGKEVGFQYRGARLNSEEGGGSAKSDDTKLLFSTDGSVVAQLRKDPSLKDYDIVIIDEAHERNMGIDELLLLIRRALKLNKKLKLIIMSATMPKGLFYNYFKDFKTVEKILPSKPNYPVEIIYSKQKIKDFKTESVNILFEDIIYQEKEGDVLIFVTSYSEAKTICNNINKKHKSIFCIPISRESSDEDKILAEDENKYKEEGNYTRKVVVGTNVIESSITINGLVYVIDSCKQLVSDYDPERMEEKLDTTFVSQAQAIQRTGRAGRTKPGLCYRLVTKTEFKELPKDPKVELLRTNITDALLKFMKLPFITNLRDLILFTQEFIEPPPKENIRSALRTLYKVGLITEFGSKGVLNEEGETVITLLEKKVPDILTSKALILSKKFRCRKEMSIMAALIDKCGKGPKELFNEPKEKYLLRDFKKSMELFKHPYGDLFSMLKIYTRYEKARARMNAGELGYWLKDNFLNKFKLAAVKDLSKNIYHQTYEEKQILEYTNLNFKNVEDSILFCLIKSFNINIAKKSKDKNTYKNFFPEKKTIAKIDKDSYLNLEKNIPEYIFYVKNKSMNNKKIFGICTKSPKTFIKLLDKTERDFIV